MVLVLLRLARSFGSSGDTLCLYDMPGIRRDPVDLAFADLTSYTFVFGLLAVRLV